MTGVRHLYVHLPFCVHRCGYCDFVTAVGKRDEHASYVDALLGEIARERHLLADDLDSVFVGGGTPTFTEPASLARLLAAIPPTRELSVEANPETVSPEIARLLRDGGVTRVSLGAQTFQQPLLDVLERTATPDDVRTAVHTLRDVGFDNISLDLIYGIPGQGAAELDADITEALALRPEHLSCYELEAKPGTRFAHARGDELARQAESMEEYFEHVVERLTGAGYHWYETANFCVTGDRAGDRDLRAHHNLNTWQAGAYLGVGVGAVSTLPADVGVGDGTSTEPTEPDGPAVAAPSPGPIACVRRTNLPSVPRYVAAIAAGGPPPREVEPIDQRTRAQERLILGLRLDAPLLLRGVEEAIDPDGLDRMVARGLVVRTQVAGGDAIALTRRGRFLGGGVTAELLAG